MYAKTYQTKYLGHNNLENKSPTKNKTSQTPARGVMEGGLVGVVHRIDLNVLGLVQQIVHHLSRSQEKKNTKVIQSGKKSESIGQNGT